MVSKISLNHFFLLKPQNGWGNTLRAAHSCIGHISTGLPCTDMYHIQAYCVYLSINLYQHKQIHTNPMLVVDWVSVAPVISLDPCLHLLQLILHNWQCLCHRNLTFCQSTHQNACKQSCGTKWYLSKMTSHGNTCWAQYTLVMASESFVI